MSGWESVLGRWVGKQQEVGPHVNQGSKPPAHAPFSHETSLTKHKSKYKIITKFKMATTEQLSSAEPRVTALATYAHESGAGCVQKAADNRAGWECGARAGEE